MIAFTILSAIAGGVCGILDGHTREHKQRQHCYAEGGLVHKGEAISPPRPMPPPPHQPLI